MCDVSGCSSEVGSVSDSGRDAMLDILQEFQQLYQARMARLERDPSAPSYSKDKMELLEDWIGDLNEQNRTLVETVKELETEASRRCEMLESRLVSTTSSTKQYMLQLHQLQRQVQQLTAGRLQAENRASEMTSLVDQLTAENDQLRQQLEIGPERAGGQHCAGRLTPQGVVTADGRTDPPTSEAHDDVNSHVRRLRSDLQVALREKEDLQEILDIRKCELEESQAEVVDLNAALDRLKAPQAASSGVSASRQKVEPPAEVHRLQRHCRDLVDQRNQALAELAKVKVRLMEVMEDQVETKEETAESSREGLTSDSDVISERDVIKEHCQSNGHIPQTENRPIQEQPKNQNVLRLQNELEERAQLISDLQGHLASARNEVALKDETLSRLEHKLDAARRELSSLGERLAQAEGERAALSKQSELLQAEMAQMRSSVEESTSIRYRLEGEADQQMAQITDLQERLLASETQNKDLTSKCVEKDVEIGRQWTTISSLQEALLETKQQVEALRPGQSFFGSLLGGGGVKKHIEETKRLKMDLAVARAQFQECSNESAKQEKAMEDLRDENQRLGQRVAQLKTQVATLEDMVQVRPQESDGEDGSDVALVEAMFERLQTELCVLADTLGDGRLPLTVPQLAEQETQTDYRDGAAAIACCDHERQLIQQRDISEYLSKLLEQRAEVQHELSPSLEREIRELSEENRLWRQKVTQGQRQLADLRRSLTSLRDGVEECKKEESQLSELRQQLQLARQQLQQQAAATDQLSRVRSQVDLLILEKQHQQDMIRELRADLTASGDETTAAQDQYQEQRQHVDQLTSQLAEQRDSSQKLSEQVERLTADHAECGEQRRRLEAQLAEARARLAETLCGQDEVHAQADTIVERVTSWVDEWRAENDRLGRQVEQQAQTIAALQMENRHLADRLALFHTPSPVSAVSCRPPSLHKPPPPAEPRPACLHSRRALFTPVEGYPHSLTDRYPGSFTEGCVPAAPPAASEPHRHSLTEGCPPTPRHSEWFPPVSRHSEGCPGPGRLSLTEGRGSLARHCHDCAAGRQGTSSLPGPPAGAGVSPVTPGTPGSVDHVPTRESDVVWPGHIFDMVAEMHDRRQPSWRPPATDHGRD